MRPQRPKIVKCLKPYIGIKFCTCPRVGNLNPRHDADPTPLKATDVRDVRRDPVRMVVEYFDTEDVFILYTKKDSSPTRIFSIPLK